MNPASSIAQSVFGTQAFSGAAAAAPTSAASTGSSSSSSSSGNSATISANDFLTLLVTEMQNQDPTQATDPNEYINQLVNVNSLEQLISINQNLSTALGVSTSGGAAGSTSPTPQSSTPATASNGVAAGALSILHAVPSTAGNLGIPASSPAAARVASALSGVPPS
ncbi:MAG TPA: flagellar hook capping FlgD N-terminal domain-containing protein [Terracidiphilus sp.]|nr:flagellar hook capping FlgD N-terminal domain-containing protein [Terracidiphilus sp.]